MRLKRQIRNQGIIFMQLVNRPTILCVDDEPSILKALQRLFSTKDFQLLLADSGADALEIMRTQNVHLIITDMRMPQMTGAQFLAQAAVIQPDTYRILMTGYSDLTSTVSAINIGKLHRYIQKPWDNQELLTAVDEGLAYFRLIRTNKMLVAKVAQQNKNLKLLNHNLEEMVQQRTEQLKKTLAQLKVKITEQSKEHKSLLEVLYNFISINPHLSGDFALNVAQTCKSIAKFMDLSKEQIMTSYRAGLFSELGKTGLPAALLSKPLSDLDNHERNLYLKHPSLAEEILAPATHLELLSKIITQQYERFNGSGEPEQLQGIDIILEARILAVARDYWAFIYQRTNSKRHTRQEAVELIKRQRGSIYDPDVVDTLAKLVLEKGDTQSNSQRDGLIAEKLHPGMQLQQNLYSNKKILLLPKGHIFTEQSINKLKVYQGKHNEPLKMHIVGVSNPTVYEEDD